VPITQRAELLGAITFVASEGALEFSPDDVELAEALALRCAQALESARLYAAARAAWKEATAASQNADIARADADAARQIAEAANAAKAEFLGRMSHELRTPLNAIGGYAQLIEMGLRGPVTPEQVLDLGRIQRSQVHLLELVDTVLAFARVEAGRIEFVVEAVSLTTVIEELEAFVAPQMLTKSLRYTCDPGLGEPVILADAGKVRQILLNLLGNAIKFTSPGGRIAVDRCAHAATAESPDETAPVHSVCVTDTGCGIPSDKLALIFEPFVQVGRQLNTAASGVGLGLAISRELARGMGGDLTVTSTPGVGSTFTLTLPAG
jgi:signal transduction histidine kinase